MLNSTRQVPHSLAQTYVSCGWWRDETLAELLYPHLEGSQLPFVVWSATRAERSTVGEVFARAQRFAGWLALHGVGPGAAVATQLPNCTEAAVAFWGTLLAGAIAVPIVHTYGPRELVHIANDCRPEVFVTARRVGSRDLLANMRRARQHGAEFPFVIAADSRDPDIVPLERVLKAKPLDPTVRPSPDSPAIIAYTSGTTSRSKGVIHTHHTMGAELQQLQNLPQPDERPVLTGSPVGHVAGMTAAFGDTVLRQKAIHLVDAWAPDRALTVLRAGDLCLRGGASYFLASLLEAPSFEAEDVERMRFVRLGGSSIPTSLLNRMKKQGIVAMRMYGSTEHPSVTSCRNGDVRSAVDTDGVPLDGVEVSIRGEGGNELPAGVTGEIFTRGPDLAMGYTDPSLTAERFSHDGWYQTGDIGQLDPDGALTITDRKADLIIRGGENISPAEVEDCVLRHPGVAEVAVFAVGDSRLGERAVAAIRRRPGIREVTLESIRQHLESEGLSRQKWPEAVVIVDDFPRTPSGKIQKALLRESTEGDDPVDFGTVKGR